MLGALTPSKGALTELGLGKTHCRVVAFPKYINIGSGAGLSTTPNPTEG